MKRLAPHSATPVHLHVFEGTKTLEDIAVKLRESSILFNSVAATDWPRLSACGDTGLGGWNEALHSAYLS